MDCFTSWFFILFHWPIYTCTVTILSQCGLITKFDISKNVPTMFLIGNSSALAFLYIFLLCKLIF